MKTVICHFHNEAYLLPWWLNHHRLLFDHGIMINHGSTDDSVDVIRQHTPHWKVVNSKFTHFDEALIDFEIMTYEQNLPGWKMALNVSEFLVCPTYLDHIIQFSNSRGLLAFSTNSYHMVDNFPDRPPTYELPLVEQCHWGIDTNFQRGRIFHQLPTGYYRPGRVGSWHPDTRLTLPKGLLSVWHFDHSPWTDLFIARKSAISNRPNNLYLTRNSSSRKTNQNREELDEEKNFLLNNSFDLKTEPFINDSIRLINALSKI